MELQVVNSSKMKWIVALSLMLLLTAISLGLVLAQPQENVITVGSSIEGDTLFTEDIKQSNDGRCTLREAIIAANTDGKSGGKPGECEAGNGADVIELPPGYVYTLSRTDSGNEDSSQTGDLDIAGDITIRSASPGGLVVIKGDDGFTDRIFHVLETGSLKLRDATIRGGNEKDIGGGIYNQHILELTNVTLTNNSAVNSGGALYNAGSANLRYVTIKGNNAASGDGLANGGGTLSLNYSYIEGDSCSGAISVGPGVENLAPIGSGCAASHSEGPGLSLLPYDFDGDGTADYYRLPESSQAVNIATAETSCAYASPDPLGMVRPQGVTCDLGANEVEYVNQPPVAVDDPDISTTEGVSVTFNVAANDTDPDGNLNPNSVSIQSGPTSGSAVLTVGQGGDITYEPQGNYNGIDSFEYRICDLEGLCDEAVVTVTVGPDSFIEVVTTADSGEGSLRWAINLANTTPGLDTIIFQIGGPASCSNETIYVGSELPGIGSSLPGANEPVIIDGTLREGGLPRCDEPRITLTPDPAATTAFSGLTILSSGQGSTIRDLIILAFQGSGIVIGDVGAPSSGNQIDGNTITGNGHGVPPVTSAFGAILNDGVTIVTGTGNLLGNNNISGSSDLAVDLGADGTTENDVGDDDIGANFWQNNPELDFVSLQGDVGGIFYSKPNETYYLRFYSSASCTDTDALTLLNETPIEIMTDGSGDYSYFMNLNPSFTAGTGIRVTASDINDNTSEFSRCIPASEHNVVWTQAKDIVSGVPVEQFLASKGEARWYRIKIEPDSQLTFDLTSLPANYDLTVYKDIAQTYQELVAANPGSEFDLNRIGAETPSEVIASASFTPGAYTPGAYTPGAYTPGAYTPGAYTPGAYTPGAYTPGAYTQDVVAPGAYTPGAYTPGAYTPGAYTPGAYTPNPSLTNIDPALYSSAQVSSLIAVSAFDNNANESVTVNTWTNTGYYYVRVRGRNGASTAVDSFLLTAKSVPGACGNLNYNNLPSDLTGPNVLYQDPSDPNPTTVILVDRTRLGQRYDSGELAEVYAELEILAQRDEVDGVMVEIGQPGSLINKLNELAEVNGNFACPYGKNIVAEAVRDVVNSYRSGNDDLAYVVILGNDNIVPFFRVPDTALLAPESWFQPPVTYSSSEASLRGNYVLTDDFYGAPYGVSYKDSSVPAIDLGVGRLVEEPKHMLAQIRAYLDLTGGVINPAGGLNTLVTGYDFLDDAANAIVEELAAGTGIAPDTLISPHGLSPLASPENPDPNFPGIYPWTGSDLLDKLTNNDKQIIFLAGHFSAGSTLAADFRTGITTNDFLAVAGDPNDPNDPGYWENVIVYSAGCHSGYNVVDEHSTPFTQQPDWASAFASRGALFVGGTGYQFGDTQFLEYSERLYYYFTQQLRKDTGAPISVGQAMVAAKQQYLAETPLMRGLHQKALIEATVFGLPMLSINMPSRDTDEPSVPDVSVITPVTPTSPPTPGEVLGLRTASVTLEPDWTDSQRTVELKNVNGAGSLTASWLTGPDGVITNMGEVALPRFSLNVSPPPADAAAGYKLRGVGFRGGDYVDSNQLIGGGPIYPLVGAPATEIRAIHLNWHSAFWFPLRTWSVNLYDNLFRGSSGDTTLYATPAQYMTDFENYAPSPNLPPQSILRKYNLVNYRLFYSKYTYSAEAGDNIPGSSAPPNIANVIATPNGSVVDVEALVVGNPGAGIQEVWATFTGVSGDLYGSWQSVDMMQDANNSKIWKASFPVGSTPMEDVRIIFQACSGTGLCSLVDNVGSYFVPGVDSFKQMTKLSKPLSIGGISSQTIGDEVTFTATLTTDSETGTPVPIGNKAVFIGLGTESRLGLTDANGKVEVTFLLVGAPGEYEATAWFIGDSDYTGSTSLPLPFEIKQQLTQLTWNDPPSGPITSTAGQPLPVVAHLRDESANQLDLPEQAVLFEVTTTSCTDNGAGAVARKTAYTGLLGEAPLGKLDLTLPGGTYKVCADFLETPSYGASEAELTLVINNAPVAEDDDYRATRAQNLTIAPPGILGNDTDADGDALSATLVSGPSAGTLIGGLAVNGSFAYKAPEDLSILQDSFTYKACDANGACSNVATVTIDINQPPDCSKVTVTTGNGFPTLWPANSKMVDIMLQGATDPDGDDAALVHYFETIWQDELEGDESDALISTDPLCTAASVRSERDGGGDGRVYEIRFVVQDNEGDVCDGSVDIATLPHDQSGDALNIKGPLNATPSASCSVPLPPTTP